MDINIPTHEVPNYPFWVVADHADAWLHPDSLPAPVPEELEELWDTEWCSASGRREDIFKGWGQSQPAGKVGTAEEF